MSPMKLFETFPFRFAVELNRCVFPMKGRAIETPGKKDGAVAMPRVCIRLFTNFSITDESVLCAEFPPGKLQDLFCYLLINHDRNLVREVVASALWENCTTVQSKKYLRTSLCQLRKILRASFGAGDALESDPSFVRVNTGSLLWLDVAEFERVCDLAAGTTVGCLDDELVGRMKMAAALYSGDLLPGNYYEWCLHERERFQEMFLALLEKLLAYYELQCDCDAVRHYGSRLLRYNPFSEHLYQRLMRIYDSTGDRGAALAVYKKCASTLREHLGVDPSNATLALYQQIRFNNYAQRASPTFPPASNRQATTSVHKPQATRIRDGETGTTSPRGSSSLESGPRLAKSETQRPAIDQLNLAFCQKKRMRIR